MSAKPIDGSKLISDAELRLREAFLRIDEIAFVNQKRVLNAFRDNRLTEEYFQERTGYGRNDPGRETIDRIFAAVFQAQSAAVRMQFVSGTHAIACALLGNLKNGDTLFSLTGEPYDTLKEVIGLVGDEPGSLISAGVQYVELDLDPSDAKKDPHALVLEKIQEVKPTGRLMFYIQKSCGYSVVRRTLLNEDIARLIETVKAICPDSVVFVDNCYGEFTEICEPVSVGANLMAGSLIKNPCGGLAIAGGYVAGDPALVDGALNRLTAPGIGGHLGLTYNQNRLVLQGLFIAPSVVAQATKGACLFAQVFSELGLKVKPGAMEKRGDIIQTIQFDCPEKLTNFCLAIQRSSPVNAHVVPEPALMPGYQDPVVMAGGTFIDGATIELSADGPMRPPYAAFVQGGLTYLHVKCSLEEALSLSALADLPFCPN